MFAWISFVLTDSQIHSQPIYLIKIHFSNRKLIGPRAPLLATPMISNHNLFIKFGRYQNVPHDKRLYMVNYVSQMKQKINTILL